MPSETAEVQRVYEADLPKPVSNLALLCEWPGLPQPWQRADGSLGIPLCVHSAAPWVALTQGHLTLS